ncbi:MAG: thioredoxin family protein [Betaproteobacteria bacterium]
MRMLIVTALFTAAGVAAAAPEPYDETADSKAEIRTAQSEAQHTKVPVLVVFGANWCADCRILDTTFKSGPSAALISKRFRVVKVDVGKFDRNLDIAEAYGVPLKKGIPAVAVLSDQGKVLYATRAGELADARRMGEKGIHDFFVKVAAPAK